MEKKTILYLPCNDASEGIKSVNDTNELQNRLYDCKIITDCLWNKSDDVRQYIDGVVKSYQPDIIIEDGDAAFYVHECSGIDRICINPVLKKDGMLRMKQKHNRGIDVEHDTHCWGICGSNSDVRSFSMLYYPNVITTEREVYSVNDVLDLLAPLVKSISNSSFTDKYGVRFCDYGRTLVDADHVLFRDVEHYEVPESVVRIRDHSFSGANLKSIVIPGNVRHIGKYAFTGCQCLEHVTLPRRLDVIREGLFEGCVSLSEIEIPQTVFSIHHHAFSGTAVKELNLPDSIQHIIPDAFDDHVRLSFSKSKACRLLRESNEFLLMNDKSVIDFDI